MRDIDLGCLRDAQHRINKVETLGALFGLITFHEHLREADIVLWIDNMAGQGVIHRGYSGCAELAAIVGEIWLMVESRHARLWGARVPSAQNIADPFSRADYSIAELLGWEWVQQALLTPPKWLN